MVGVRRSARSGSVVLATPPSCLLKSPHALRVPEYRLALRVGSVPTPRVIMQAVFPWRQGTPCGDMIASVTFSQPERLPQAELRTHGSSASGQVGLLVCDGGRNGMPGLARSG